MSRSSAIPVTASAELSLHPSRGQWCWLAVSHLLVPLLLVVNRSPWPLILVISLVLGLHLSRQVRQLSRRPTGLRFDSRGSFIGSGETLVPVTCKISYLSRWLLVLDVVPMEGGQHWHLALWRDGYTREAWRLLQVQAREWLRPAGQGAQPAGRGRPLRGD